ncbi:MAG: hypothetical protein R3E79_09255 [Caldilineaceae bacterium]
MSLEPLSVKDKLSNIVFSIVGDTSNEFMLRELFAKPMGEWLDLLSLCNRSHDIQSQLTDISEELEEHFIATWVDYSKSDYGEGYRAIIFFSEALAWSSIAIYNYELLMRKHLKD